MKAVHVFWSLPRGEGKTMEQFEVMLLAISALAFHKSNQVRPVLYTDEILLHVLEKHGLTELWAEIDTTTLRDFKFKNFPAAAKMHVLQKLHSPVLLIDVDAVVYERIPELSAYDVVCAHQEIDVNHNFYPSSSEVSGSVPLDHSPIFNVSLLWINHEEFRKKFTADFFRLLNERDGRISDLQLMTYAEQRLAGHLSKVMGLKTNVFRETVWSCADSKFIPGTGPGLIDSFHHLWHQKKNLMKVSALRPAYIEALLETIEKKIPGFTEEITKKISCI